MLLLTEPLWEYLYEKYKGGPSLKWPFMIEAKQNKNYKIPKLARTESIRRGTINIDRNDTSYRQ